MTDAEFHAMYQKYAPFVLARCRAVCGNRTDAEEALQDTFVRVWNHRTGFDGRSPLGWLHTIARSVSIDLLRKRKPWNTSPEAWDFERLVGSVSEDGSTRVDIRALLETLEPVDAAMLRLRHVEGWTFSEIGEHFETSDRSVRRRLAELEDTARKHLVYP